MNVITAGGSEFINTGVIIWIGDFHAGVDELIQAREASAA